MYFKTLTYLEDVLLLCQEYSNFLEALNHMTKIIQFQPSFKLVWSETQIVQDLNFVHCYRWSLCVVKANMLHCCLKMH